jgi:hypothetical protein
MNYIMDSSSQVNQLIEHKNNTYQKIYDMERQIQKLKDEISSTNKKIFSTCNHNWVRDWDASFDCHCKRICSICKLYPNPNYNA